MKKRFKGRHSVHDGDEVLRFRNIGKPTQDALEHLGVVTYEQLQGAVDRYGVDGLIAQMEDSGYTPPKHERWRLLGAVRGKHWKDLLKEMRSTS